MGATSPALCRKRVPDPFDVLGFASHFDHGDHIEAHAEARQIAVLLKELGCCPNEAGLLAPTHAGRRPTEPIARPGPYLDDHQDVALTRDDIEFAQAAPEVELQNFETLASQVIRGDPFSRRAEKLVCSSAAGGTPRHLPPRCWRRRRVLPRRRQQFDLTVV
jgi:hypothetical protein